MDGIEVMVPEKSPKIEEYANLLYEIRKEKGMTLEEARGLAVNYTFHGTLMMKAGEADGMVSGANHSTADTVRPALQIIKSTHKDRSVSTAVLLVKDGEAYVFNTEPERLLVGFWVRRGMLSPSWCVVFTAQDTPPTAADLHCDMVEVFSKLSPHWYYIHFD